MNKILTLDCEITECLEKDDPRWNDPSKLTVSVLGFQWQEANEKDLYYWVPDEGIHYLNVECDDILADDVQSALDDADIVITFNGEHFDFPLLEGAGFNMSHAKEVSYDIMAEFQKVAGHRISLDALAKNLVGRSKTGSGYLAPQLWCAAHELSVFAEYEKCPADPARYDEVVSSCRAGAKFLYEAVVRYCLDDVTLTREIFDRLCGWNGQVSYWNYQYKTDRTVTLSLPEGFRSAPPVEGHRKRPQIDNLYLVASDKTGIVSMIPVSAQTAQITDWRIKHGYCSIVEREVTEDEISSEVVEIPF